MKIRNRTKKVIAGTMLGLSLLGIGSTVAGAVSECKPDPPKRETQTTSDAVCRASIPMPWCRKAG